ncbi:MAG: hypothetical protein A2Z14_11150 [Chloroflexi bacterium RBG_16_48_8]|nr:MAG: hypothetical protein A2Z14_11150 [Chloroflexi bacterium RBG_16_48_8]
MIDSTKSMKDSLGLIVGTKAAAIDRRRTMLMLDIRKYRGVLLGLAICDALGTTLEFQPPGIFDPIEERVGAGPFNLEPG